MDGNTNETILIAGSFDGKTEVARHERGLGGGNTEPLVSSVGVSELRKNVDTFFRQISEILETDSFRAGAFQVDNVELSAQITGEGKICLLGSGTRLAVGGGLKFVFKRKEK